MYCTERKDTVDVTYHLKTAGVSAAFFHAGLDMWCVQLWHLARALTSPISGSSYTTAFPKILKVMCRSLVELEEMAAKPTLTSSDLKIEQSTLEIFPPYLNNTVKHCITPVCRRQQIGFSSWMCGNLWQVRWHLFKRSSGTSCRLQWWCYWSIKLSGFHAANSA